MCHVSWVARVLQPPWITFLKTDGGERHSFQDTVRFLWLLLKSRKRSVPAICVPSITSQSTSILETLESQIFSLIAKFSMLFQPSLRNQPITEIFSNGHVLSLTLRRLGHLSSVSTQDPWASWDAKCQCPPANLDTVLPQGPSSGIVKSYSSIPL